jgi:hypothetical protein
MRDTRRATRQKIAIRAGGMDRVAPAVATSGADRSSRDGGAPPVRNHLWQVRVAGRWGYPVGAGDHQRVILMKERKRCQ